MADITTSLRGFFVCNNCRECCSDGEDEVGVYGPESCPQAYFPRKQAIGCLGDYCDNPCHLQEDNSDLTVEHLIPLVMYLGKELNKFLITGSGK